MKLGSKESTAIAKQDHHDSAVEGQIFSFWGQSITSKQLTEAAAELGMLDRQTLQAPLNENMKHQLDNLVCFEFMFNHTLPVQLNGIKKI